MDETVNNVNEASDINSDKKASLSDSNTAECNNNATTAAQHNNQKDDFDIVDFIISHSDYNTVRKKSKLPKILLCVILVLLIAGICFLFALWSSQKKSNPLIGSWSGENGTVMQITEDHIMINGSSREYSVDEESKNVIKLKVNSDIFKMLYELNGNTLTLTIADESGVSELKYTRKSD